MDNDNKLAILVANQLEYYDSNVAFCIQNAKTNIENGNHISADMWIEKAAQYAWGFNRPNG